MDVLKMVREVEALVGSDGSQDIRVIVECAAHDDPQATAHELAGIVLEARRLAERVREVCRG